MRLVPRLAYCGTAVFRPSAFSLRASSVAAKLDMSLAIGVSARPPHSNSAPDLVCVQRSSCQLAALRVFGSACCDAHETPTYHTNRPERQIVQGLSFLHLQNIVHGDIKPQNLLVR